MAKSKQSNSPITDDIFSKLVSQHNKVSPGSAMMGSELDSEITTWIDSGSLLLNMILSNKPDGGWPCGRVVQVFGRESIGKSTLAYKAIAHCQRVGGICIYADLEHAANKRFMEMLGVDLDRMIWTDIPDVEDLFQVLENNLKTIIETPSFKGKPTLIVIDSVAALQTKAELEGGYEFNMNVSMGKAKQLHKVLRKINYYLSKANACLFAIDQIKDNATGYGPSWSISGGKAFPFYSSVRLFLEGKKKIEAKDPNVEAEYLNAVAAWKAAGGNKSGQLKPERAKTDAVTIGYEVEAYTIKNKTAPPDRQAKFRIIFAEGLDDAECYLDYLVQYGAAKLSGAYYTIVGWENNHGSFWRRDWIPTVLSDYDTYQKVKDYLVDKLTVKFKDTTGYLIEASDVVNVEKEKLKELKEQFKEEETHEDEE